MQPGPDPRPQYNPYAAPTYDIIAAPVRNVDQAFLATRWTRLGARMVDYFLIGLSSVPTFLLFALDQNTYLAVATAIIPVSFLGFQCYLVATTGQSFAKKALGIRIVRMDGSPAGFVAGVVLREWIIGFFGLIPFLGGLLRLIDSVMIFGEEQRCLHDVIAGTKVVLA